MFQVEAGVSSPALFALCYGHVALGQEDKKTLVNTAVQAQDMPRKSQGVLDGKPAASQPITNTMDRRVPKKSDEDGAR